jgi:hypothetical protein
LSVPKWNGADDFEAWIRFQGLAEDSLTVEQISRHRDDFAKLTKQAENWRSQAAPSRSLRTGDRRYAVAIQDGDELGLSFWIRRSATGEIFLLYSRDGEMDPHASYHRDGTYHQKTYGLKWSPQKRQPLDRTFRGTEHLGKFAGHGAGPRIAETSAFDDVLVVPPGALDGRSGCIVVDLVEPGAMPAPHHRELMRIVCERTYQDASPWIVVAIAASPDKAP